jgi:hypothetical protein
MAVRVENVSRASSFLRAAGFTPQMGSLRSMRIWDFSRSQYLPMGSASASRSLDVTGRMSPGYRCSVFATIPKDMRSPRPIDLSSLLTPGPFGTLTPQ